MPLQIESLTGDAPLEVPIGNLETSISELWRSAAKDAENPEAVLRAAALTLVVFVESPEAAEEVRELAGALSEQNPCRVITLIARPQAKPDGLRSWISAQCKCDPNVSGRKQIRSEQIAVSALGRSVPDLGSVALPLTLSGLPIYFWWRAGRFSLPDYFDQIFRVSTHVLVDSARAADAATDLLALARMLRERSRHSAFMDLNWARLTPWRELIAQCFDNPGVREYVERVNRVRIEYESNSPRLAAQESQALLVAGWLTSRLKWQPLGAGAKSQEGVRTFPLESHQQPVEIQLVRREFEGCGGGVCFTVSLQAAGDPPASFRLERGCDGRNVVTRAEVQGRPAVTRTVRLEVLEEAQLLNEELQFPGRDRIFEDSLECTAQLLEK